MEISVREAKKELGKVVFLDVREPFEWEINRIEGALHIPLRQLPAHVEELRGKKVIVYCHHGNRSLYATMFLRNAGIDAVSMAGGIDEWAIKVDGKMERY
jgi:rhodanese-related sulfurtransferase